MIFFWFSYLYHPLMRDVGSGSHMQLSFLWIIPKHELFPSLKPGRPPSPGRWLCFIFHSGNGHCAPAIPSFYHQIHHFPYLLSLLALCPSISAVRLVSTPTWGQHSLRWVLFSYLTSIFDPECIPLFIETVSHFIGLFLSTQKWIRWSFNLWGEYKLLFHFLVSFHRKSSYKNCHRVCFVTFFSTTQFNQIFFPITLAKKVNTIVKIADDFHVVKYNGYF